MNLVKYLQEQLKSIHAMVFKNSVHNIMYILQMQAKEERHVFQISCVTGVSKHVGRKENLQVADRGLDKGWYWLF